MLADILVNFAHAAVVVFGLLTLLWAISVAVKDASLVDIFWGFGFLVVGAVCLYLANPKTPYLILLATLPIIWGVRLSLYLAKRNLGLFNSHGGEDVRYIAMRKRAEKKGMNEMTWRLRSLFTIYFGQGLLIMIISAPVWVGMATGQPQYIITVPECINGGCLDGGEYSFTFIGLISIFGAVLWFIGFFFEAIGDAQLSKFMKTMKTMTALMKISPSSIQACGNIRAIPIISAMPACGGAFGLLPAKRLGVGRRYLRQSS